MFTFSILDLFASFVQKSFWNFGVAWLISQYFSRRDLKPVAFLFNILETCQINSFIWKMKSDGKKEEN